MAPVALGPHLGSSEMTPFHLFRDASRGPGNPGKFPELHDTLLSVLCQIWLKAQLLHLFA